MTKPRAVIFDLDGTLANLEHRLHYVRTQVPPDWKAFFEAAPQDSVIESNAELLLELRLAGNEILICSGRPLDYLYATEDWLQLHGIIYSEIHMRPSGDFRTDFIVKEEMLKELQERFDVWLVVDDRQSVVDMWRRNGLNCLQAAGHQDGDKYYSGSELHILVGPSCSGKTYWAQHGEDGPPDTFHVSSDILREHLCGDWKDQSKNEQVFDTAHATTKAMLSGGCKVMFDATNLKRKDRLAVVACGHKGTKVVYHVFPDVPLDILTQRATRKGIPHHVIEKHIQTFKSQQKDILSGDDNPFTEVVVHPYQKD